MILGAHQSIDKGLHGAFLLAREDGCESLQVFTANPQTWKARKIQPDEAELFRQTQQETGVGPVIAHNSYLINLATPDKRRWNIAVSAFQKEMQRCELLGIPYLVFHPGAHMQKGKQERDDPKVVRSALERIAEALNKAIDKLKDSRVTLVLETTAGQGTYLGHRFEHLAEIMSLVEATDRLGACFDTCHSYAAGYDIRNDYENVWKEFDNVVGLERLKVIHLNDSKYPLASRHDRHEQIGEGDLGLEPFRMLVNDERFADIPGILETPHITDTDRGYAANLKKLRTLARKPGQETST